uniref:peptidylprolyl isomerase n=1 Tax=Fopius arisanus TaxID=64838 RepID=A0A0C9RN44_9HYME
MDVGEVAQIEISPRFAYGDLGKKPDIPPGATLHYNITLKAVEMEPIVEEMGFTQRREFGNKKRERGNWWFARNEPTLAIQCYRRALDFLQSSGDDHKKKPEDIMTDSQLQILLEDRTKVYNNLAAAQIKTEAYGAALESVNNVLRADPQNIKALFRKGTSSLGDTSSPRRRNFSLVKLKAVVYHFTIWNHRLTCCWSYCHRHQRVMKKFWLPQGLFSIQAS